MEKSEERWWDKLLQNEEKLDLQKMNPEKPMDELDDEAQAKIKQMMYDEQQKRLGLPTSDQQVTNCLNAKTFFGYNFNKMKFKEEQ